MALKELFNQSLIGSIDNDMRFAVGIPSAEGCNNVKKSVLFPAIAGYILRSGSYTVTIGNNSVVFSSDFETSNYSLFFFDSEGAGISIVSQNNLGFIIDCLANGTIYYLAIRNI